MKILINSDGITGREVNPCAGYKDISSVNMFRIFEDTVKSYTVIGSCKAGDVVEADLVWQYKLSDQKDVWVASYVPVEVVNGETRRAYQVVETKCVMGCKHFDGGEIKHHKDCYYYADSLSKRLDDLEGEAVQYNTIDEMAEIVASEYATTNGEFSTYTEIFKEGANYQHSKTIERVIGILHYEMTTASPDYLQKLDNIITLVRQLKP